ncbi:hypothetical protein [Helicobacter sp. T3_23-1059]
MQQTAQSPKINNTQKTLAIVYKSKYGATKKYAKWLAQAIKNMKNTQESAKKASEKKDGAKKQTIQKNIKNAKNSPIHCINCDIYDAKDMLAQALKPYQIIIFAGALYGGELSIGASLKDFLASQKNATKAQKSTKATKSTQNPQDKYATTKTSKIYPNIAQIYCLIIGLSSPKNALNYQKALDKNLTNDEQKGIRFYFLQGGIDFDKLDSGDRARMEAYRAMLRAKEDKTPEQEALLKNQKLDFARKDLLEPIIDEIINAQ